MHLCRDTCCRWDCRKTRFCMVCRANGLWHLLWFTQKRAFLICNTGKQCCAENSKKGAWNVQYLTLTHWNELFLALKFVSTFWSAVSAFLHLTTNATEARDVYDAVPIQTPRRGQYTANLGAFSRRLDHICSSEHRKGFNTLRITSFRCEKDGSNMGAWPDTQKSKERSSMYLLHLCCRVTSPPTSISAHAKHLGQWCRSINE